MLLASRSSSYALDRAEGSAALRQRELPIPGLTFASTTFEIHTPQGRSNNGVKRLPVIEVVGRFDRPLWHLRFHDHPIELQHGRFRITIPVADPDKVLTVEATVYGPFGTVETEQLEFQIISFPQ